jgi:hypothetical protein
MSDDRNEGECYGPFHPGFICEDCADRIRALGAQAKKQMARAEKAEAERDQQERFKWTANAARDEAVARLAEALERWPSVLARVKEAEAELAALENRVTYYENNGKLELDDHGHSVPYGGFCLKRAAGRDSGIEPVGTEHQSRMSSEQSALSPRLKVRVDAAAKSAAHFQKALREAIEREAHDA